MLFVYDWFSFKCVKSELSLSDPTITNYCSFAREVLVEWAFKHTKKIGGEGLTVKRDKSKFVKSEHNVGCLIEGQWVFGGICQETCEFFTVWFSLMTVLPILFAQLFQIILRGGQQ